MQPKSTLRNSWFLCAKIIAVAMIFVASTQTSFAQEKPGKFPQQKPGYENTLNFFEKQKLLQERAGIKDNDAGIITQASAEVNRTEAICTTWNFSLTTGDPTTSLRAFRDGVPKTCAAPGTCQAGIAGSFRYQIFQWVNCATQCVTVRYTATNANFSFVTVHNAPPTLTNLCANWVGDPGSSATSGQTITFSFNGVAATTYYFLVTSVGTPPCNGTIEVDAGTCSCTPCSATPSPGNTIATPNPVGAGAPLTLTVQNNPAVANLVHHWQRSATGNAPWTTIGSGPSNSFVTSQVAVNWYRDSVVCAAAPAPSFGISNPVQVGLLACGWSLSTASPIAILDQGVVNIGGTLYSFAGVSANAVVATSNKFDGTTWTPIAPTPQPLEYPGVCTDGVNAYILGGASSTGASLTTLYRYNVASNTYTTLAPFSTGVWNPSAVFLNGKIYKFCGTAAASTAVMEVYDVATNTWSPGTPYPAPRSFVSAIAANGKIYACGGVNTAGLAASNQTFSFDPGTNTWTPLGNMAAQHWGHAGDFYNNGFVIAGGYINGATTIGPNAEILDLVTGTWGPLPNLLTATARVGGAATGIGGSFYVIGGRTLASAGFGGSTQNQRLFCIPPNPCTGTPSPGNTIASTNPVCSGVNFTLSLQNNPFVSGLTYDWEWAPTATGPWTDLPGVNTNVTYSGSQPGARWYRCNVSCTPSGLTGTSNPVLVADGQGIFTVQPPSAVSVACGSNITIPYTATGNSLSYSWEYRITPTTPWLNLTGPTLAGAGVSGQTTSSLTLTNVSAALNGYQLRGIIQGPCTAVDFTNIVTLTVTPYQVTINPPASSPVTICAGSIQQISITNTVSAPTTSVFSSGAINIPIPDNTANGITSTINVSGIPTGSVFSNIRVRITLNPHTYPADLVINLKGPHPTNVLSLYKHKTNTNSGAVSINNAGWYNATTSKTATTAYSSVPAPPDQYGPGASPPTGPFRPDALNGVTNPGYTIMDPAGYVSNALTFDALIPIGGGGTDPNGVWTLAICDGGPADIGTLTNWAIEFDFTAPVFATGVWTSNPAAPNTMFTDATATTAYVAGAQASTIWVKPAVNTAYTVVVTTATPCVSAPKTTQVNVVNPITGLNTPANTTVCVGSNASFSVNPGGGPLTYQWEVSVNSGLTWTPIAGATSATLNLTAVTQLMNNNLYRVAVNAGPCGAATTAAGRLNVNPLPVVTISATSLQLVPGATSTISGTSSPAPHPTLANWVWTLDGNTVAGATGSSVTANVDQTGAYQASVTDVNGCRNSSNTVTIGWAASDKLWIIPNPNKGQFDIRLYYSGTQSETRKVQIYNAIGQLMAQQEYNFDSNTPAYARLTFDLPQLAAGSYAVKVVDKNGKKITSGIMIIVE